MDSVHVFPAPAGMKRAVVIGAGISGLAAAHALAGCFDYVTILENDTLSSDVTARPGVPQGRQAHALLGGAVGALEELIPGISRDLAAAGAVQVNPGYQTSMEYPGVDPFPRREWDWVVYSLSRSLIESTIRKRLEDWSNVEVRGACRAHELIGTPDGTRVAGVRFADADGAEEAILADLVVDASRHGALTLSFLAATGQPVPDETTVGVDIRYATGIFALSRGVLGDFRTVITFPKPPDGKRYGYLVPIEDGCYQLLLVGRDNDIPPTDHSAFVEYARNLSTPTIFNAMQGARPLGTIAPYGFPESRWRHFGRLTSFPRGLLPVGDTICSLNPVYGQGMTVAIQEANLLRRLLSPSALAGDPLDLLAKTFFSEADVLIGQAWAFSTMPDFAYPHTRGQRPTDLESRQKRQSALVRIASGDASVYKLLIEVRHLMKPLGALNDPELQARIDLELAESNFASAAKG
jgi:2-polyprenyl-6-methoxyphenol hydroxylase-like FAD-dependent oxidoreductase